MNYLKTIAPNILRIGIALVMLWFGIQQGMNPEMWTGYLPEFVNSLPFSPVTFVYLNSWFEIIAGLLLISGLFTRIASLLLALHLVGIVFTLGMTPVGVRDFGLTIALVSIFFAGADSWSLDNKLDKKTISSM